MPRRYLQRVHRRTAVEQPHQPYSLYEHEGSNIKGFAYLPIIKCINRRQEFSIPVDQLRKLGQERTSLHCRSCTPVAFEGGSSSCNSFVGVVYSRCIDGDDALAGAGDVVLADLLRERSGRQYGVERRRYANERPYLGSVTSIFVSEDPDTNSLLINRPVG